MVIGASGKIGSIVLKNLATVEGTELFATTRRTNIRHHGAAFVQIPFSERYSYFDQMDVIISATASPHYTITKQRFSEHIRTKKPRVLVDLAVPMDLEKSIKDMDGVRYYNIDDLELIARENNEKKKNEAEAAGLILENYEDKFEQWRIFKHYQNTMDTVCNFMERESRNKGVEHAVRKLFYQVRDSAQPEGLELFFQSLEERNRQWGRLTVIGFGPGGYEDMTNRAGESHRGSGNHRRLYDLCRTAQKNISQIKSIWQHR